VLADAALAQGAGEPVDAGTEGGVGEPVVAIDDAELLGEHVQRALE
jgi:hypothetical protein